MAFLPQFIFLLLLVSASYLFARNIGRIRRNILLGKDADYSDQKEKRWKIMAKVALGQSKMVVRPIAGFLHILVYIGFVLINIEVLEIVVDGILGTHRFFQPYLGDLYVFTIAFCEVLALLVLIACVIFLTRRYIQKLPRLNSTEMKGWPIKDATIILVVEIVLMTALLVMNATDKHFQEIANLPISSWLVPLFAGFSDSSLAIIERTAWWGHIIGIFMFLNYLPFSKHFHIILAFPNTWYSRLSPAGEFANNASVTTEVQLMMDPSAVPPEGYEPPTSFGVKDVQDLTWKNLMDAYTCTECGRCTSNCPANLTGKKLSPRKIMMDTRDRLETVGSLIDSKKDTNDGNDLHSLISAEELWACTTCNACVEACPVNISPVEIIMGMRQYLVMEKSEAPAELNSMFANMENNGAPWQFPPSDRANWRNE
jgi:heterodisulfide reductase subunit C/nitrate reductase gamma subunit